MTQITITPQIRRRITGTLFVSQSLFSAALIATFTLTPIIASELSGSDSAAGVPSTMTLLGRAAAAYPIGWLMDRIGRRWGLSLGYGLSTVGLMLSVWAVVAGSFIGLLAGMLLFGMGRGASEQGRYVAAEVHPAARRARVIGLIVFAGTIGAVGGPLLVAPAESAALSLGLDGLVGPYLVGLVLVFVGWLLIAALLRPDPKRFAALVEEGEANPEAAAPPRPLSLILRQGPVVLAVASMAIGQLVMTLIMVITPLHMDHQNHATEAISLVIMAHTLGMFGLSGVTGWLIDRYGRVVMIIFGALVLVVSSVMTPFVVGVPLLAAALFLLGLGWNFCFVAGSSLLSDSLAVNERGSGQGASEVLVALASGAGSLATGGMFAGGGILAVSGAGLAFSLLLMGVVAWMGRDGRAQLQPSE